jgi:hypothetical protein
LLLQQLALAKIVARLKLGFHAIGVETVNISVNTVWNAKNAKFAKFCNCGQMYRPVARVRRAADSGPGGI